jgi:DNA-binding XRE family transcriptional regulator
LKTTIFASRLKALRLENKRNQKETASLLEMPCSTYSYYENAKREPSLSAIRKIADFYSVTSDYLIGRADVKDGILITNLPDSFKSLGITQITLSSQMLMKQGLSDALYNEILSIAKNKT